MLRSDQRDELEALRQHVEALGRKLARVKARAINAEQEAQSARAEIVRLNDQLAAAERDQQDLRTARARLARLRLRGLLARILNRP